jgi:hypothetical protein
MRIAHLSVAAGAALLTFVAGSSAIISAQPRRAASTAPLLPISERDIVAMPTQASGCVSSFAIGRRTLAYAIGEQFLVRTATGRHLCRITDVQIGMGTNDRASVTCAGMQISFRRTGRVRSPMGSDSGDWPATMTIRQGRTQRVLAGNMESAC